MSLRLFIGGMRGSRPCTGGAFEIYGGDTTCLLVTGSQGERLVLDAGSGLTHVAAQLAMTDPGDVTLLFSHYHLDHMLGLTMNPLFYHADWAFRCVGPTLDQVTVRDAVTRLLGPPYWPVACEQMGAAWQFDNVPEDGLQVGGLRIRSCPVPHPGGCLAYRIEDTTSGQSLVYATDMEWQDRAATQETAFLALCRDPRPVNILVMDAHFERARAQDFAGWGHTCWQDDLDIALSAGVPQVVLGHHAPEADDQTLLDMEQQVTRYMPNAALAKAGQWITLGE